MWTPWWVETENLRYEGIVKAIAEDIGNGRLQPGERLPPQRDVAFRLGLALGTVTRAYAEAERRGLLIAQVGRGSFIAEIPALEQERRIDFSHNLPPAAPARAYFAGAFSQLRRRSDLLDELNYGPPEGWERDRRAGQAWIAMVTSGWEGPDWRKIICCVGAQQAMLFAVEAATPRGSPLIAEEGTFWGLHDLVSYTGHRLVPAALDHEGLRPDALEQAARTSGARVAYILPFQNPTARVMSLERRNAIVEVARRLDLLLIEDDLYSAFGADGGPPPIAALAPERTFYINGVSKVLAPGLRTAYLAPPPGDSHQRIVTAIRATMYCPPNLGAGIVSQWIKDGAAEEIRLAVKAEMRARVAMAQDILGARMEPPSTGESLHVWLPMPTADAEAITRRALRRRVEPTPPKAPL
ncbi:MAG TPA: PLP-dependent aminotransferase family protein, partial [Phenylobacterium sp.]|nr:PLP-dependent aminotransferase family protein [Phenylobacterium sp.]